VYLPEVTKLFQNYRDWYYFFPTLFKHISKPAISNCVRGHKAINLNPQIFMALKKKIANNLLQGNRNVLEEGNCEETGII
jgi:hypothetical protein